MSSAIHTHPITEAYAVARLLKSLGNPQRLLVLCWLIEGPTAVGQLAAHTGLPQPTLSLHLAKLESLGLVASTPSGRLRVYRVADARLKKLLSTLQKLYCTQRLV